ncbi:uncharacterized protein LOC111282176 isoform X2 [Durio zibethinus]|uniref:Uncharacterized protein LOC111282176 isoform X2 n=1 Tax=Durio zibethinus TaxID=66656 RepID=A0A6P5XE13_DURZI|nr:uncharacterized protein LOC111282176 isoform X2 [Durio zibethinus]
MPFPEIQHPKTHLFNFCVDFRVFVFPFLLPNMGWNFYCPLRIWGIGNIGLSSKRSRKARGKDVDLEDFDDSEDEIEELMVNGEEEEDDEEDIDDTAFREKAVDVWQRKTEVTTGSAAIKSQLQAFNQNISEQVAANMRDPSKMVKQMQQRI